MDKRLETICKEMNENPASDVIKVIDEFLQNRPEYTLERLREDFEFLKKLAEKKR